MKTLRSRMPNDRISGSNRVAKKERKEEKNLLCRFFSVLAADSGSNFRIDSCQYVYNLSASALGVGTYRVDININGQTVDSGFFGLK